MGDRNAAIQFYNSAVAAVNDSTNPTHLTHAYQLFASACFADPTYGLAYYQAGNNNSDLGKLEAAIAQWRIALACENTAEERAKILVNLGWRYHSLGRSQEALEASLEAIELVPLPLAYLNLSLIYGLMDQDDDALWCARKCFALEPDKVEHEIALAFALLFTGHYADGFCHFEKRFEWRLKNFLQYPYPKWEGEREKTIFLVADQGLGDTLSFARFVEAACARSKYVHAMVQPELMRLFNHSFMHIRNLNLLPSPTPFPQADHWSTFVSLPYALGLTDAEIESAPGIEVPRIQLPQNWKVPDRKLHIGIAWAGSPLNDIDRQRNIPMTQFLELYQVPGVQLYAMQVGDRAKEMDEAGCAGVVRNLAPYIHDVVDTMSLMRDLDLIITVESALGHIAGTAHKECWIPYSYAGRDYRLGYSGKNPLWYKKHRAFRMGPDQRWGPVFAEIAQAVREKIDAQRP